MKIYNGFMMAMLLLISAAPVFADGPTLTHEPPTGVVHSTPGVTVKPVKGGGSVAEKVTKTTETSADGKTTTTTTVTKTVEKKDGKTVDKTEITKESKTTAKDTNGKEYVSGKTTTTKTTTRTTKANGETSTESTSSGHVTDYGKPDADGVMQGGGGLGLPAEKLENGPTGIVKKTWKDEDGNTNVETSVPVGGETTVHTRTTYKDGTERMIVKHPDGSTSITFVRGKERTREDFDKDGKKISTEKTDKKGVTTREYTDAEGNEIVDVKDKDGKLKTKTVREKDGTTHEIRFLRGKPWNHIVYDADGKKVEENIIDPKDRKGYKDIFGDDLGMSGMPGASTGRDILVGMPGPAVERDHGHADHPHEV